MSGDHPRQSRRVIVAAAAVAVVLLGFGALLARWGRPADPETKVDHRSPTDEQSADRANEQGHAGSSGFGHNDTGAGAAAVAHVAASQRWLYMTDEQLVAAVSEVATPDARERLVEENLSSLRLARDKFAAASGRIWWVVRPLAWRVESYTADRARVSVWVVTVLSATGVAAPQADWSTVNVELAWVDGSWRVDDMRYIPGPTPMTGPHDDPWNAEPFDEALAGFTRVGEEAES